MSGRLIVIEGLDGSGKSTQLQLLRERMTGEVRFVKFPDYESDSSALVKMYLSGQFGTDPNQVNAYAASAFYAVDRFASYRTSWGDHYDRGGVILCDRYATSNAVHQASKVPADEQDSYLQWLYDFEYKKLGLPRPDLTLYLDVPTDFTERLLRHREQDTNTKADIHEQDTQYLSTCRQTGRSAADYYGWTVIHCVKDGVMRSIEDIHQEIYRHVAACLEE